MSTKPVSEKVLDRVKKLLFKAQSGSGATEAEAQSCMTQAQALMAKHLIDIEDIGGISAVHKDPKVVEIKAMMPTKLQWWEKDLANVVAQNFRCFTFWNTYNNKSTLKFLGLEDDAILAREMFQFARKAIEHLSILFLDREGYEGLRERTKARNAYIDGFIRGLGYKFNEQVAANGWLAIIEKPPAVTKAHDAKKLRIEPASVGILQGSDYAAKVGFDEGKRLDKGSNAITERAAE